MPYHTPSSIQRITTGVKSITADTTLTGKDGIGTIVLNSATGAEVTLPKANGSGVTYTIIVGTTVTSNSYVINASTNGADFFGNATLAQDSADTVVAFEAAADNNTYTMNGTTQGGLKGQIITITDVADDTYIIDAMGAATGTEATPFSTV